MGIRNIFSRQAKERIKEGLEVQEKQNLEVRDKLAMDRTKLANERTLMSYMRSAFGLLVAGLTFIKLFWDDPVYVWIGVATIPVGILVAVWGFHRYSKTKRIMEEHTSTYMPTSPIRTELVKQEKLDSSE
ncbi:YidH family protein [Rufibacter roseus]|uniref:YidH family protein n=1 Tax=Rufibacter roseus TaxID=1567108 RepID=A0ABW2DGS5_9BACT|nr:DUF202 domain-containing protein [Rufibacter roseus]